MANDLIAVPPPKQITFLSVMELGKVLSALRELYGYELEITEPKGRYPIEWDRATIYQVGDSGKNSNKSIGQLYSNKFANAINIIVENAPTIVSDLVRMRAMLSSADEIFGKYIKDIVDTKNNITKMCDENASLIETNQRLTDELAKITAKVGDLEKTQAIWGEDGA